MSNSIKDLDKLGFLRVKYPQDWKKNVQAALSTWKAFTKLPLEIKKGLPYSNNSRGVGYEYKDGSGSHGDHKENFDVTLGADRWLLDNIGEINHPHISDFLHAATRLFPLLDHVILNFAKEVEEEFGVKDLFDEVKRSKDAWFIRFIHYFEGAEIDSETAAAHVDQGGYTPHLIESAPGLQFLTREGEWINAPISEDETVVIPSMQMQLRSEGRLRATPHRVVATKETSKNGRYSGVCFVGLNNTLSYDKAKWGRLQEMVPGFNYNISPQEFKKFFKN